MVVPTLDGLPDVPFQGKDVDEHLQMYFRQHWIRLIRPLIILIVETGILIAGFSTFGNPNVTTDPGSRHIAIFVLTILFLLTQFMFLATFYRHFLHVIIISDKKLHKIKKTLMAFNDHQHVNLFMLQRINKRQHGIIQNMLGFGTLQLEALETQLRIHFVPNIQDVHTILMHLHLEERTKARQDGRLLPGQ